MTTTIHVRTIYRVKESYACISVRSPADNAVTAMRKAKSYSTAVNNALVHKPIRTYCKH